MKKLDMSQQAAMKCEKDLLRHRKKLPKGVMSQINTINNLEEEKIPYAIGRNKKYGYFILVCGQGPMFVWAENNK